ncbi:endonuclease III [Mucisphaera calidilacus]|uniref:Endonuclease III n=1 Tax=Mucisphaera calidilacus TaxID=2527982 RepID=A0A518BUJ2_9BACT|nr:endonuclease III [Mucisphaera calidilacus]QDU70655.1 Ultraviolet N-glycosylase/AP lyase [Mucisphaera calidilacus]
MKPTTADKRRAARIYKKLLELYPDADCALHHRDPWQLVVATILSAQCTDARVNIVTPELFKAFPTPQAFADATPASIEPYVKTCGFFRNKAKNIHGAAIEVVETFQGEVPRTMEQLLTLPGVARKTANVVLGNAFGINVGMVVDTHIGRLAQRLGFTTFKDPVRIERDLMARFPAKNWTMLAHLLIAHGRAVCDARKPRCSTCPLKRSCPQNNVTNAA